MRAFRKTRLFLADLYADIAWPDSLALWRRSDGLAQGFFHLSSALAYRDVPLAYIELGQHKAHPDCAGWWQRRDDADPRFF